VSEEVGEPGMAYAKRCEDGSVFRKGWLDEYQGVRVFLSVANLLVE